MSLFSPSSIIHSEVPLSSLSCELYSGVWSESIQYNPRVPKECLEAAEQTASSGKLPLAAAYARGRSFYSEVLFRCTRSLGFTPVAMRPQPPV